MKHLLFLVLCNLCLVACRQTQNKIPVVGEIDISAIAQDTTMQLGLESSYEYHKTIQLWNHEVIDVVAWGKKSKGELAFVFRYRDKTDTIMKMERNGVVVNSFKTDLNENNNPEILVVLQSPGLEKYGNVVAFEIGGDKPKPIQTEDFRKESTADTYRGRDTIHVFGNEVIRTYPIYHSGDDNCCPSGGSETIYYKLRKGKLEKVLYPKLQP